MLRRLNDLPIFDPGRVPGRERLARVVGSLAIGAFVLRRVLQFPSWPGYIEEVRWTQAAFARLAFLPKSLVAPAFDMDLAYSAFYTHSQIRTLWMLQALVWLAETGILLGYILALLTRVQARSVARGFMQTVFPLVLAGLPFVIVSTGYTFHAWFAGHPQALMGALYAVNAVLVVAGTANMIGLLTLRRAFAIMAEARVFIRSGVYRWIRHPLYAAHFVIYLAYTILHFHAGTVVLYATFVAGQTLRARIEEGKLSTEFPEYAEYRRTTGMFFPKWGAFRRTPS